MWQKISCPGLLTANSAQTEFLFSLGVSFKKWKFVGGEKRTEEENGKGIVNLLWLILCELLEMGRDDAGQQKVGGEGSMQ